MSVREGIMEYDVACVTKDLVELVKVVNKHIKEGWRPQGGVVHYTSTVGLRNDFWAQAMVRESK